MQPYLFLIGKRPKPRKAAEAAFGNGARLALAPSPEGARPLLSRLPAPHLILLDVPAFGSAEAAALERLRADPRLSQTTVVVLASKAGDAAVVAALERGADEFLIEPMRPAELAARLRALLRRLAAPPAPARLVFHDIGVAPGTREACVGQRRVSLTGTQLKVLRLLLQNAGRVLERESIIRHLWNTPERVATRSADMHVSLLRRKLRGSACRIETVRPAGYRLVGP